MGRRITAVILSVFMLMTTGLTALAAPSSDLVPVNMGQASMQQVREQSSDANFGVSISAKSFTYDGKTKKPTVTLYWPDKTKVASKYYTVTFPSSSVKVGTYKWTLKLRNGYAGQTSGEYVINPPKTTVSVSSIAKTSAKFTIKKKTTQTTGYQLQYEGAGITKKVSVGNSTLSYTARNLKAGTSYRVKVRTYKKLGGKTYYSDWSAYKIFSTKGTAPTNNNTSTNVPTNQTDSQIQSKILAYKTRTGYKEGTFYDNSHIYRTSKESDNLITNYTMAGCAALAMEIQDAIFGENAPVIKVDDYRKVRVGDSVRLHGDTHSVLVYAVNGTKVEVVEGNYNSSVHWGRIIDLADPAEGFNYIWTRRS